MDAGSADPRPGVAAHRLEDTRLRFAAQAQRFEQAKSQLQATIESIQNGRWRKDVLYRSAFARMQARLDSMPVIEQAKGVLMAQQRCGPEEAFDLLRQASQRSNMKLHVLAAHVVASVATQRAEDDGEARTFSNSMRP